LFCCLELKLVLRSFKTNKPTEAEKLVPEVSIDGLTKEDLPAEESDDSYFKTSRGMFDQLTLNDYMPGQGIPPHVDTHSPFEEVFVSLSLKSGTTMHFKTPEGLTKDLYLQPRSLVVFSGEVRYNWMHSIAQRKIDNVIFADNDSAQLKFRHRRVSLTFRKVALNGNKCVCKWT
jgi:alkylated DNA repair dioxygenase AlkB